MEKRTKMAHWLPENQRWWPIFLKMGEKLILSIGNLALIVGQRSNFCEKLKNKAAEIFEKILAD